MLNRGSVYSPIPSDIKQKKYSPISVIIRHKRTPAHIYFSITIIFDRPDNAMLSGLCPTWEVRSLCDGGRRSTLSHSFWTPLDVVLQRHRAALVLDLKMTGVSAHELGSRKVELVSGDLVLDSKTLVGHGHRDRVFFTIRCTVVHNKGGDPLCAPRWTRLQILFQQGLHHFSSVRR